MIEISSLFYCFGGSNTRGGGNREDERSNYSADSGGPGGVAGCCGGDYDNSEPLDVMECNSKGTNTTRSHGGTSSTDEDIDEGGRRRQQQRPTRSSRRSRRDYNYDFPYQKSFIEWFVDGIVSSSGYGNNDHTLNVTGKRNIEQKCESYNTSNGRNVVNENTNNMNMNGNDGGPQRRQRHENMKGDGNRNENGGGMNNPINRVRSMISCFSNNSAKKNIPTTITAMTSTTPTTNTAASASASAPQPTVTPATLPTTTTSTTIANHTKNNNYCSCQRFMKFAGSILAVLLVAALVYYVLKKDLFTAHIL